MRRFAILLAAAALALSASLGTAQAAGNERLPAQYGVLTPDQIGLWGPAQGFYPFFVGLGQGNNQGGLGLGGVAPTTLGASALFSGFGGCGIFSSGFCPFLNASPYTNTFISQGFNIGGFPTAGLGNIFGAGVTGGVTGTGLGIGFNPFLTGLTGTGTVFVIGPGGTLIRIR